MKRATALLLSLVLLVSCLPMSVFAAFTDEANWPASSAWAKEEINYMVGKKVLNGYAEDGSFRPEVPVTRSQFVKMMVETFGLTAEADVNYSDVAATDWFYPYVRKAAAQGFLLGYGSYFAPNENLTRQEAAALLARYMNLGENEKVSQTTYPDYTSIRSEFRDYVLQVSYIGLFKGDADTGNFRPDGLLKRSEAAAILYRAAGTIYKASATGTEADANDENAVIGVSGITVSNATIKGKLLITEGASSGTVTLSGCDVDTLVLRGTTSVILSGCTVDQIIVDSNIAHTASVSLISGTSVEAVTAKTPVEMTTVQRTSVKAMTLESTAKNSSFGGAGTLTAANVKATGFESAVVPTSYTIATGITAMFAGNPYTSAAAAGETGFSAEPTTYAYTAGCHLTAKPTATGILYYYFTNSETVPTKETYNTAYVAAGKKAYIGVTANTTVDQKIADSSEVSAYAYVVVMLQSSNGVKYQPKVIANKASNGFAATPIVSASGSYEKLNFTTNVTGLVSYYYTNTATVPTATAFATNYSAVSNTHKGMIPVTANKVVGENTFAKSAVSAYEYIVLQLKDATGNSYQPIVISRTGAPVITESGFTVTPTVALEADKYVLKLTAGEHGTIEYYYSTVATIPTAEQFTKNLENIAKSESLTRSITGLFDIGKDTAYASALSDQVAAKSYPYLVLRLTSVNGTEYCPVVVALPAPSAASLSPSGFSVLPSTAMNSGFFQINVEPTAAGKLYYYITDNNSVPDATAFKANYQNATKSSLSTPIGGTAAVGVGRQIITTSLTNQMGLECAYLVLMLETTGTSYMTPVATPMQPIVISLIGAQEAPTVHNTVGFTKNPVYTQSDRKAKISLTASVSGTVWYYFTDEEQLPDEETLKNLVQTEAQYTTYAGYKFVTAKTNRDIEIYLDLYVPKYVVVMLEDDDGIFYKPVVLSTSTGAGGVASASTYGFSTMPTAQTTGSATMLSYNALGAGSILWYYTNTASVPANSEEFFRAYISAGAGSGLGSGSITVSSGGAKTATLNSAGYSYMVLIFRDTDNMYYAPLLLSTTGATIGGSGGISGFVGEPYILNGVLFYQPSVRGRLYYCFTDAENYAELTEMMSDSSQSWMMAYLSGTDEITTTGLRSLDLSMRLGQGSITIPGLGSMAMSLKNVAIWIDTGTYKTDVIFVPVSGGSSSSGSSAATGFTSSPLPGPNSSVYVFPGVTGTVKYFYTNATTEYTALTFNGGYSSAYAYGNKGTVNVTAGQATVIPAPTSNSFSTLWIMLETSSGIYAPVKYLIP